jgi:hypothetical protein
LASTVTLEAVLRRLSEVSHQLNILVMRMDELDRRLDSVPKLVDFLAFYEDPIRPFERADNSTDIEDLVG